MEIRNTLTQILRNAVFWTDYRQSGGYAFGANPALSIYEIGSRQIDARSQTAKLPQPDSTQQKHAMEARPEINRYPSRVYSPTMKK